ncbi:hypothetical protein EYF80_042312 [Liparis tanakae]|uniref:Uncharacterized protein n=1 Tax=Liparis tanakae TaxID=230148 RepID=A0A4Z2G2U7_9TELE|nr:hypothetical protein EYF80_042312 [Liparis tanakae]
MTGVSPSRERRTPPGRSAWDGNRKSDGDEEEEEEEEEEEAAHLNFWWEALRYSLMGLRWALSPRNILLEAACCSILATEPRLRRCSVVSWPPADTSMMSKAATYGILSTDTMMADRNLSVMPFMFLMEASSRVRTSSWAMACSGVTS